MNAFSYVRPVWIAIMLAAEAVPLWLVARRFARAGRAEVWLVSALLPVIGFIAMVVADAASGEWVIVANAHVLASVVLAIGWRWWRTRPATVTRVGPVSAPSCRLRKASCP